MKREINGYIILTQEGKTARLLSRYRPPVSIFAFCPTQEVAESLTVEFGVMPFVQGATYIQKMEVTGSHVRAAVEFLVHRGLVKEGESYIVLHGDKWSVVGGTSTVKIVTV